MPRTRPPERFNQLVTSAIKVFTRRGYRRTQMADVARDMGVSPGTLYNYVASKEALFHLLIERAFRADQGALPTKLPLPTPPPKGDRRLTRQPQTQARKERTIV